MGKTSQGIRHRIFKCVLKAYSWFKTLIPGCTANIQSKKDVKFQKYVNKLNSLLFSYKNIPELYFLNQEM